MDYSFGKSQQVTVEDDMGNFMVGHVIGITNQGVQVMLDKGQRRTVPMWKIFSMRGRTPRRIAEPPDLITLRTRKRHAADTPLTTIPKRTRGSTPDHHPSRPLRQLQHQHHTVSIHDPDYHQRKQRQNKELVHDMTTHLHKPMKEIKLLALDDVSRDDLNNPRTMMYFLAAGGLAKNYYSPNTNQNVVNAILKKKGNSKLVKLYGYILDEDLPRMDALYLDYCGTWEGMGKEIPLKDWYLLHKPKIRDDVKTIFLQHEKLLAPRCLLHLTIMRGRGFLDDDLRKKIVHDIERWTTNYGHGTATLLRQYDNEKMWKLSFLLIFPSS